MVIRLCAPSSEAFSRSEVEKKLQKKLDNLCAKATLQLPKGEKGKNQSILLHLESNKFGIRQIGLIGGGGAAEKTMEVEYEAQDSESFVLGYCSWRYSPLAGMPYYSINAINRMQGFTHGFTAAAAYAWTSPMILEVRVHYVDWISGLVFIFDFNKNEVTIRDTYPNSKPVTVQFSVQ